MTSGLPITLDWNRVMSLLRAVDNILPDGPRIVVRVGGGVGVMTVDRSRLTEDIDMFEPRYPSDLHNAILTVANNEGLPDSWMNNDPAHSGINVDYLDTAADPLFYGRRLTVYSFDIYGLLALKVLASRDRDTEDILLLMHKTRITTPSRLRRLLDDFFGHQPQLQADLDWAYLNVEDLCDLYRRQRR